MLLRNMDLEEGLCNGVRMKVVNMKEDVILCQLISGPKKGNEVMIHRIINLASSRLIPFTLVRYQFPLILSYAMTINKSQGQTFDRVGVYLDQPVFTHGQLYVAFSRIRKRRNLKVEFAQGLEQGKDKKTGKYFAKNVVYKVILGSEENGKGYKEEDFDFEVKIDPDALRN